MTVSQPFDTTSLINRLLNVGQTGGRLTTQVFEAELLQLCQLVKDVFIKQSSLIEIEPPVIVCGDIHGQYADLLRVFDRNAFPPESNYIFLGDYVDRGRQNIETICLMFCYKIKYSENFFMLRGNHECPAINRVYGFFEECLRRYRSDVFNWMPLCGLIGNKILCMHGGLSPQLKEIDQLRWLPRPQDPPNPSMGIDFLWADPDLWVKGWQANTRGVSYVFGQDIVVEACNKLDIDLVVRAHQVVQDGYEFFANRRLVTIFSAPHYCGQFDNAAATMAVAEDLSCAFSVYRPMTKQGRLNAKSVVTYKPIKPPGTDKTEEKNHGAFASMFKSIVGKNRPACKIEPTPLVSLPTPPKLPSSTSTSCDNTSNTLLLSNNTNDNGVNNQSVGGMMSLGHPMAQSFNRGSPSTLSARRLSPARNNTCYLPVNTGYTIGSPKKTVSEPVVPPMPPRNGNNNSVYLPPK